MGPNEGMEAPMFAKLATVIIILGAMFGALLVNRQERIDTAAEVSRIHFKLERNERERTRREAKVATALMPDRIRELLVKVESKPIPFRADPLSATEEALEIPQLVIEPYRDGFDGERLNNERNDGNAHEQELGG
jgi:hypothetical protein